MPFTKDAFLRYRTLDQCFKSQSRKYTIKDLIRKCNEALSFKDTGVSLRTVRYDIAYMKSEEGWNAPIETYTDGSDTYYHYSDSSFSILNVPISETQLKQIKSAIDILKTVEGLPNFKDFGDSLERIDLMASGSITKPCFGLETNEFTQGRKHIKPLFYAIQEETVVKIKYKPFNSEAMEFIFHPQFLKQYNSRWYIFGIDQSQPEKILNLALDRITSIKTTSKYTYNKLEEDWNEYFDDIIGVTNDESAPVEKVHFLVHGLTAHYIDTKPLHGSQYAKWVDDNTLDVTLKRIKINYELKRTLLSYAPSITILAPQSLVEEHKKALQLALEQYK